jgi:hypothetical protein
VLSPIVGIKKKQRESKTGAIHLSGDRACFSRGDGKVSGWEGASVEQDGEEVLEGWQGPGVTGC